MAVPPTDRTFIEAVEALTWIAFGECINAEAILGNSIDGDIKRWKCSPQDELLAWLEHSVEGKSLPWDDADYTGANSRFGGLTPSEHWAAIVELLKNEHGSDEKGLLANLRAYLERAVRNQERLNAAEHALLEACRAERLTLWGYCVPWGKQPDGSADPVQVPVAFLLRPVAISLFNNRLTFDYRRHGEATRNWDRDYANLRARVADVLREWPQGLQTDTAAVGDPLPAVRARGLAEQDAPLIEEMHRLVESGVSSPWKAANGLAERAAGGGSLESKAKRLSTRYAQRFRTAQR